MKWIPINSLNLIMQVKRMFMIWNIGIWVSNAIVMILTCLKIVLEYRFRKVNSFWIRLCSFSKLVKKIDGRYIFSWILMTLFRSRMQVWKLCMIGRVRVRSGRHCSLCGRLFVQCALCIDNTIFCLAFADLVSFEPLHWFMTCYNGSINSISLIECFLMTVWKSNWI